MGDTKNADLPVSIEFLVTKDYKYIYEKFGCENISDNRLNCIGTLFMEVSRENTKKKLCK